MPSSDQKKDYTQRNCYREEQGPPFVFLNIVNKF